MNSKIAVIARAMRSNEIISSTPVSIGDGEWAVEVHADGYPICEFCGSNGTRGTQTDVWGQVRAAISAAKAYNVAMYGGGYVAK